MLENNLEGQVKHIFEEFQLTPSTKLWDQVKADLSKSEKRRFIFIRPVILCALLSVTTYWLHDLDMKNAQLFSVIKSHHQPTINSLPSLERDDSTKITSVKSQPGTNEWNKSSAAVAGKLATHPVFSNKKDGLTGIFPFISERSTGVTSHITTNNGSNSKGSNKYLESSKSVISIINSDPGNDQIVQIAGLLPAPLLFAAELIKSENVSAIEMMRIKPISSGELPVQKTMNLAIPARAKDNISSKWNCFISISGGVFNTGTGFLNFSRRPIAIPYYPTISTGTGSTGTTYPTASIGPGISVYPAVKFKRALSAKTQLSLGIGYQYASTIIKTGPIAVGSSAGYFSVSGPNSFTNQYQFLQFPVEIESKLGKGLHLPLYVNAGIVYSSMIGVNALQYNLANNFFYKDNNGFNQHSLGMSAGLQMAIIKKQKMQWLIGPQFNYSLTNFGSQQLYMDKHAGYFGIQVQKKI